MGKIWRIGSQKCKNNFVNISVASSLITAQRRTYLFCILVFHHKEPFTSSTSFFIQLIDFPMEAKRVKSLLRHVYWSHCWNKPFTDWIKHIWSSSCLLYPGPWEAIIWISVFCFFYLETNFSGGTLFQDLPQ